MFWNGKLDFFKIHTFGMKDKMKVKIPKQKNTVCFVFARKVH